MKIKAQQRSSNCVPYRSGQAGMSLIEMIIGLTLFLVVGAFGSKIMTRIQSNSAAQTAETSAGSSASLILNHVYQDFRFARTIAGICDTGDCKEFTLTRNGSDGGTFDVTYTSQCVSLPTAIGPLKASKTATAPKCLAILNCGENQYPMITREQRNPNPVETPLPANSKLFPLPNLADNSKQVAQSIVGASACLINGLGGQKLVVDTMFLAQRKRFRVVTRSKLIDGANIDKIKLLPN